MKTATPARGAARCCATCRKWRDLVNDLLESERLGAGHAALHREPTDPAALAREVVEAMAHSHPGRRRAAGAGRCLPTLNLDRTRMRLLLRNLLDNALRHSAGAPQPPVLRVACRGRGGIHGA
jgi:signal transduction histidine kinase